MNDFINQEHQLHLQAQVRRISAAGGSTQERKKNIHDPIAYPCMFFRKDNDSEKDVAVDSMFSTVTGMKR